MVLEFLEELRQCHDWYGLVLLGCSSQCGSEAVFRASRLVGVSCVLTREGELICSLFWTLCGVPGEGFGVLMEEPTTVHGPLVELNQCQDEEVFQEPRKEGDEACSL